MAPTMIWLRRASPAGPFPLGRHGLDARGRAANARPAQTPQDRAASHDRERSELGAADAARDRRVDMRDPQFGEARSVLLTSDGLIRLMSITTGAGLQRLRGRLRQDDVGDRRVAAEHRQHDMGVAGLHRPATPRPCRRSRRQPLLRRLRYPQAYRWKASGDQSPGHDSAGQADAKKCNIAGFSQSVGLRLAAALDLSLQRPH